MTIRNGDRISYRRDPNYYRMRYQLAAQLLHAELERERGQGAEFSGSRPDGAESALKQIDQLIDEAQQRLRIQEQQVRKFDLLRMHARKAREERLRDFLDSTVIPCAQLVGAGALLASGEVGRAEELYVTACRDSKERSRAAPSGRGGRVRVSYRVFYNFACFQSQRAHLAPDEGRAWEDGALGDLTIALQRAGASEAADLARWADRDPTLRNLRDSRDSQFHDLVNQYSEDAAPH